MLQWLRRIKTKKGFRVVTTIFIAVLSVGLVGSFAIWAVPNLPITSAQSKGNNDPSVQYQQFEEQIAELEKSKEANKDDPEFLEKLGNAYYDYGFQMFMEGGNSEGVLAKLKAALENYEAALKLAPEDVELILQAATTATGVGDVERAEALYKEALKVEPDSPHNKLLYGNFLLYVKGDYDGSRQQLQEGLKLDPDEDTKSNLEGLLEQVDSLEKSQKEAAGKEAGKDTSDADKQGEADKD